MEFTIKPTDIHSISKACECPIELIEEILVKSASVAYSLQCPFCREAAIKKIGQNIAEKLNQEREKLVRKAFEKIK